MSARRWTAVLSGSALLLGTIATTAASPAAAVPTESHCGTEASGSGNNGFVNHAQLTSTLDRIEQSTGGTVEVDVAGYSNQGREIYTARVGEGDTVVFVESQIHGNENHGTEALLSLLQQWGGSTPEAAALREEVTIVAIPRLNVDGGERDTRQNEMTGEVCRLRDEFGTVDYFIDLHNQWSCYATEDLESMSPLSISAKFIDDPSEFGTWPKFDMDASKRANVAVYEALQGYGESGYGDLTLYPQDTNLPGTALGSFALRGSAVVLFETSSQTQYDGMKRNGMLRKQIEIGLGGLVDAVADGSITSLDATIYDTIPRRVFLPAD